MKLMIITETIQDQLETISTKNNIPQEEIISTCKKIYTKYWKWILQQWYQNNIKLPEDGVRITEVLQKFDKNKKQLTIKDINKYKTIDGLEEALGIHAQTQKANINLPGVEIISEKGPYIVAEIINPDSLAELGEGTKWCTKKSYPDCRAEQYIDSHGYVYIIFKDFEPFIQYTPDYKQIMDVNNEPVDAGDVININNFNEMMTPNNAFEAYNYVWNIIEYRLPAVEPMIMRDPEIAAEYAVNIIKGRWPEAEPIIIKDPDAAVNYAIGTGRGKGVRWPEAEPTIMKNPKAAAYYAKNIIKGRWPEAEPYIMKDPMVAFYYTLNTIRGRWPEAEPYIMKDPTAAANYSHLIENL